MVKAGQPRRGGNDLPYAFSGPPFLSCTAREVVLRKMLLQTSYAVKWRGHDEEKQERPAIAPPLRRGVRAAPFAPVSSQASRTGI